MPVQVHTIPTNVKIDGVTATLKHINLDQTGDNFCSFGWRNDSMFEFRTVGTAGVVNVGTATCNLGEYGRQIISEDIWRDPQTVRAGMLSGFILVPEHAVVMETEWGKVTIPGVQCPVTGSVNWPMEPLIIRRMPKFEITDEAQSMIENEGLNKAIDIIEKAVIELWEDGANIQETTIEEDIDPEIENNDVLGVTVWLKEVNAEDALELWKLLKEKINVQKSNLSGIEQKRFERLVSVGVDIE